MGKSQLNIILGVDTNQLTKALKSVERKLGRFARNLESTGRTLTQNLTLPLAAVGGASLAAFGNLEKLEKGLAAILGPGADVRKELDLLRKAAEAPGLSFEQAVKGSIQLQAVGFSADQARESISALGTAVALTGGSADKLEQVVRQITQINSKGRILSEDFQVIQENAPAIGIALKKAFNDDNIERIRATGISASEFTKRLVKGIQESETFQGVTGGLANAFENFQNNIKFAAAELGRTISETVDLEAIMNKLSNAVSSVVEFFKALTPEAQKTIVVVAAVVAGIGPLLIIVGKLVALGPLLIKGVTSIIAVVKGAGAAFLLLTSPIGLTIAFITGLIALVVVLYNEFGGVRQIVNASINVFVELAKTIKNLVGFLSDAAKGFKNFFERDFAGAAANFSGALNREIPSFVELGANLGKAAVTGFKDETNRIAGGIQGLKNKIFKEVKAITGGGAEFATPTAPDAPTGKKAAPGKERDFLVPLPDIDFNEEAKINIEDLAISTSDASKVLTDYYAGLKRAQEEAALFGGENAALKASIDFTNEAMQSALNEGYTPTAAAVLKLRDDLAAYQEQLDLAAVKQQEFANKINLIATSVSGVLDSAFTGFFDTLANGGKNAFKSFADGAKQALIGLIKQLVLAVVKAAALALIFTIISGGSATGLAKIKGILNLGTSGSLFSGLFKGGIGLAQGGIIPPGYPNDTFPARLSSGEAVIPLSKLDQYTGQGGGVLEARIEGNDLLILLNRAEARANRAY